MKSALYFGHVLHARNDIHARRAFRYPVYVASLDLAELPALDRLRLFSYRRRNVFSFDDRDYASLASLAPTTRLVTNLAVLGYVFNPVSFFLGYEHGALTSVLAEVNNTYGGRHRYVFGPEHRLPGPRLGFRRERELFVSPFLHGDAAYELFVDAPLDGDTLAIAMHVLVEGERVFVARLEGTRRELTDRTLALAALRYPLMSLQVIGAIHYEALKLHLLRVPYRRPGADHRPIREPTNVVSRPPRSTAMK